MAGVLLNGLGDIRWPDLGFGFGYLGLDFAPLWALVAFLFNYVPTIGSIIAAIPAVLLALVQLDVQSALWVALGYLVVNAAVGTMIEPRFMGQGLGLSTLVVFVSLASGARSWVR